MTAGHKGRECGWGVFLNCILLAIFRYMFQHCPRCQMEKTGRVGQEVLMVSSREVGRPCLFKVIVITHSELPGFNSFKSKELRLSAAGLCPSLPTNTTAPLAKCACAAELRSQGEEVKDKTVHCRINL